MGISANRFARHIGPRNQNAIYVRFTFGFATLWHPGRVALSVYPSALDTAMCYHALRTWGAYCFRKFSLARRGGGK